jgi:hypothetical protein
MSMLTICAADNLCGAGSFHNDYPIEIQSLDSARGARHGLHPDLLRRVACPGSGRIFPFFDETVAVEARSFARKHAWLGGIDFAYGHPFDELIYRPAAHQLTSLPPSAGVARPSAGAARAQAVRGGFGDSACVNVETHPDRAW